MTGKHEPMEPVNLAGVEFYKIKEINVTEFHELSDAQGKPSEVHLWITMEGLEEIPFIMRFHAPLGLDQLIVALMTHRKRVWG